MLNAYKPIPLSLAKIHLRIYTRKKTDLKHPIAMPPKSIFHPIFYNIEKVTSDQ